MKRVGIIPCRMGCGSAEPLIIQQCQFYLDVAKDVTGAPTSLVQTPPVPALVVQNETLNERPSAVFDLLCTASKSLIPQSDVIIIDLDVPMMASLRGAVEFNIFCAIQWTLEEIKSSNSVTECLVVLVPEIPNQESASRRNLQPYLESGKLILIQDNGLLEPDNIIRPSFNREQYCLKLMGIRGKPIDLLQRRLVIQRGHFRREVNGRHMECVDVYFDGKLCGQEIRQLVDAHLKKIYISEKPHILYHPTFSNWIEGPLSRLANDLQLPCHSVDEVLGEKRLGKDLGTIPPLLVVQLMDSGNTIAEKVKQLQAAFPIRDFNCLAILSTVGDKTTFGKRIAHGGIDVEYLVRVVRRRYSKPDNLCPMCNLDISYSTEGEEDNLMLTSYDFWEMTDIAGLKPEDDSPNYRPAIKKVPDFPQMFNQDGAWLATKIGDLLEKVSNKKTNDLVVVCPDQKGSQVLTEYLRVVCGVTVIRISDEATEGIRLTTNLDSLVGKWEKSQPAWYVQLCSAAATEFVIMDEFCVTGGKRRLIEKLLHHLKKDVICFFAFADFCPQLASDFSVPIFSLYEWQAYLEA